MVQLQDIEFTTGPSATIDPAPQTDKSRDVREATQTKPFVVAISGCSSSGKTLLSLLLEVVFSDLDLTVSESVTSLSQPIVIHEDDYFKLKEICPLISFKTTHSDSDFILKSLCRPDVGLYHFKKHNETSSIDDIQNTVLGERILGNVTGPDTDCWEAIDVSALATALSNLKVAKVQEGPSQRHTGLEETRADMQRWTECVRDLRELVKQRIHKGYLLASASRHGSSFESSKPEEHTTILRNLCIVEGFLLYSDPDITDSRLCRSQDTLMDLFDIKLFLPTSKDIAKRRRFSRKPYIDHPSGYRLGGQYWKTEGYFENVAWPNYQRLHRWLLSDGTATGEQEDLSNVEHLVKATISPEVECMYWEKGDVYVGELDAGVEETLRWAVEIILAKMARQA